MSLYPIVKLKKNELIKNIKTTVKDLKETSLELVVVLRNSVVLRILPCGNVPCLQICEMRIPYF